MGIPVIWYMGRAMPGMTTRRVDGFIRVSGAVTHSLIDASPLLPKTSEV